MTLAMMPLWMTSKELRVRQLDRVSPAEAIEFQGRLMVIGEGGVLFNRVNVPMTILSDGSFLRDANGQVLMTVWNYRVPIDELHKWEVLL